jgi:hypothetical protein
MDIYILIFIGFLSIVNTFFIFVIFTIIDIWFEKFNKK